MQRETDTADITNKQVILRLDSLRAAHMAN